MSIFTTMETEPEVTCLDYPGLAPRSPLGLQKRGKDRLTHGLAGGEETREIDSYLTPGGQGKVSKNQEWRRVFLPKSRRREKL
jgi:hypothetical protein